MLAGVQQWEVGSYRKPVISGMQQRARGSSPSLSFVRASVQESGVVWRAVSGCVEGGRGGRLTDPGVGHCGEGEGANVAWRGGDLCNARERSQHAEDHESRERGGVGLAWGGVGKKKSSPAKCECASAPPMDGLASLQSPQ